MKLPNPEFPVTHGYINVFDLLPLKDTYNEILEGETSVTMEIANYVNPHTENDVQRVIYATRAARKPWTQEIDVTISEFERQRYASTRSNFAEYFRYNRLIVFAGRTSIGDIETSIIGRAHRSWYGWARLAGLELDMADLPAVKVAASELPLGTELLISDLRALDFYRPRSSSSTPKPGKYDHLYGDSRRVVASLRKSVSECVGEPYVTPTGRQSF